jgi:hypothetical protein
MMANSCFWAFENWDPGTGKSPSRGMLLLAQVHKFGGTCVSAAERIASAAQLVLKNAESGDRQVTAAPILRVCILPFAASCCRWPHSSIQNADTGALWPCSLHSCEERAPENEQRPLTSSEGP